MDWEFADTLVQQTLNKIAKGGNKGYSEKSYNDLGIITLQLPKYYYE
jgi:hypothetical protein